MDGFKGFRGFKAQFVGVLSDWLSLTWQGEVATLRFSGPENELRFWGTQMGSKMLYAMVLCSMQAIGARFLDLHSTGPPKLGPTSQAHPCPFGQTKSSLPKIAKVQEGNALVSFWRKITIY